MHIMRFPPLLAALFVLCSALFCTPAFAQSDDAPSMLQLGVLDVSAETNRSKEVRPAVRSWLVAQTNLTLVNTSPLRKTLKEQRITEVALRQKKLLVRKTKRISKAMSTHNVQGLLLMNVQPQGQRTQLTFMTVGPNGGIVKEAQQLYSTKKGISEKNVHDMLDVTISALHKRVFAPASTVPRELEPLEEPDEESARASSPKEDEVPDNKDKDKPSPPNTPPSDALPPALVFELSGLGAYRTIEFETNTGSLLYSTPYIGGRASLTAGINQDKLHIAARAEGAYAAGSAHVFNEDGTSTSIEGTLALLQIGAQLGYTIHPRLALMLNIEAQTLSMLVEVNARYTGHRYISALSLIGVHWTANAALAVTAQLGLQSVISAQTSGDAYGTGAFAPLGGAHARISALYKLDSSIGVRLSYAPQWIVPNYDVTTTSSDDVLHVMHLGAQVQF